MSGESPDIATRKDLEVVLAAFYDKAIKDDVIGHFFTIVIPIDLAQHLPLIADFWEAVIFEKSHYNKNLMAIHQHIYPLSAIHPLHVDRWVLLFTQTVDSFFKGDKAELMKQRAQSIATLMKIKLSPTIN